MKRAAIALLAGAVFGAGVCISGMVRPSKVLGFLDVGGAWDASLALVMASAVALHAVAWAIVRARGDRPPPLGGTYPGPPSRVIDARLIGGSILFGVGWGLSGFCPGPAMVTVVTGARASLVFVGAMALAMAAYQRIDRGIGDGRGDDTRHAR